MQSIKNYYHFVSSLLANLAYAFPSRKLTVIGVSGTDGKTTTTSLIYHILSQSGKTASMITSVGAMIGDKNYELGFHVTNPASWQLQGFIKKAVRLKKDRSQNYIVIEATSHGLHQHRVWGIKFDVGVITNVTEEHLDYHKTYENYVKAKAKLLLNSKTAIINLEDKSYPLFINILKSKKYKGKVLTYGLSSGDLSTKNFSFKSPLIGDFNIYNCLAAASICKSLGIEDIKIKEALKTFVAPKGREEIVYSGEFTVMIDFAHTPNSIDNVLRALRPKVKGKLIHVFGSAGLRDKSKRPVMGKNSSKYADIIILTSEDPRTEDPNAILDQIESGIEKKDIQIFKIADREKAIEKAISLAKKDDMIVTTGKAHEKSMNYGKGEQPWDEFEVVGGALSKYGY